MYVLRQKLKRLKPILREFGKPLNGLKHKIEDARKELLEAQKDLSNDTMNIGKILRVKQGTTEVLKWDEIEDMEIKQIAKIERIRSGDGNNRYFYASIKNKHKQNYISILTKEDGSVDYDQFEIEEEVLNFYTSLMGTTGDYMVSITQSVLIQASHLSLE